MMFLCFPRPYRSRNMKAVANSMELRPLSCKVFWLGKTTFYWNGQYNSHHKPSHGWPRGFCFGVLMSRYLFPFSIRYKWMKFFIFSSCDIHSERVVSYFLVAIERVGKNEDHFLCCCLSQHHEYQITEGISGALILRHKPQYFHCH